MVQAQLGALLGPHGTNSESNIPVTPIASFAANADSEAAYKQFCNDLYQLGITEDIMRQKEDKIREILKSQGMIASSRIGGNKVGDHDRKDRKLETAYKEFCEGMYQLGATEDMLPPRDKILRMLRSRGVVASSQSDGGNTEDKGQSGCSLFISVQLLTCNLQVVQRLLCLHLGRVLSFG